MSETKKVPINLLAEIKGNQQEGVNECMGMAKKDSATFNSPTPKNKKGGPKVN